MQNFKIKSFTIKNVVVKRGGRPYLFVDIPYTSSTNAKDRFNIKNSSKFLEFGSEKMIRIKL